MRLVTLAVVCSLFVVQDGGSVEAALPGFDSAQRTQRAAGGGTRRRTAGDFLAEDPSPCFSLRENEDQRQLVCNDRRSHFNYNPLSLRFGKRYDGYVYRRAIKRARMNKLSSLPLFSRELEVPS